MIWSKERKLEGVMAAVDEELEEAPLLFPPLLPFLPFPPFPFPPLPFCTGGAGSASCADP